MVTKTMKGVSEETWSEFKGLAAKNKLKTGEFFEKLVFSYKENSEKFWKDILRGKKIITNKEAEELEAEVKKLRKERGFRI